ncbi:MAG: hypothetical protein WBW93_09410 [Steroidobacteraceae bacterium]
MPDPRSLPFYKATLVLSGNEMGVHAMGSKSAKLRLLAIAGCLVLSGCAASSPFIMKNTVTTSSASPESASSPYEGKVFVTGEALPASVQYQVLGTITVGTVWYGSADKAVDQLVAKARKLGANVIIDEKTWWQPSGFSWAAPHASGRAIRVKSMSEIRSLPVAGNWY